MEKIAVRKKSKFNYEIGNVTTGYRVFSVINTIIVIMAGFLALVPIINTLAISFSTNLAVSTGKVWLWPVDFTLDSYRHLTTKGEFWNAMGVSFKRVLLGGAVNMLLVVLGAYPLSKDKKTFPARNFYVGFILITMMFNGGLIPNFFVVKYIGLMDSIWAMILPQAVDVFCIILLMNFFRQLPKELEEAAFMDGANHVTVLFRIMLPISKPALATIALFVAIHHWNEWFSAMLYMKSIRNFPLQTYLRSFLLEGRISVETAGDLERVKNLSNKTVNSAQLFIAMVPILMVYPFLQKYFTKGLVLGSVKE